MQDEEDKIEIVYEEGKLTESIKKLYVSKLTEKTLYEYKLFDFIL